MKTPRYLIVALSLITVIAVSMGSYTYINRAVVQQVYVYNCGIQDYKPTSLTQFCADAGVGVGEIKWEDWSAGGATGTGRYALNTCEPSCVAGNWLYEDVNVKLSKAVHDKGKTVLSRIDIATVDAKKLLPRNTKNSDGWDLVTTPLG